MARLLISWLNEEVRLSQMITSLEEDFRDGYILGELLMRYNQQEDFNLFDRKDTPECRIRNFCLLEPTLRRLEVPFNFKLAYDIMDGKFGIMRALLSELRAVLDRVKKNSHPPIAPPGQNGKIMRVMNPGKTFYDMSMSASFEKSMRIMMENPTEALIKKAVTNRFIALGNELREQVNLEHSEALGTLQSEKQRQQEIFRHRKKHEGEFAKAWDLINVEQWKKNQTRAVDRKALTARLESNQTAKLKQQRTTAMQSARETTFASIDDFDRRLEKEVFREDAEVAATLGSSLRKSIAGASGTGVPELSYIDKANLQNGLVTALKKIKENHDEGLVKQQSHDRRRRKFVREIEFSQSSTLQHSVEKEIVCQLLNKSESENVETRAKERVLVQKQMIAHNRANRDTLTESIEECRLNRSSTWLLEETAREINLLIAPRVESQSQRVHVLQKAKMVAERQRTFEVATEVMDRILDLTDWIISCRHFGLHHITAHVKERGQSDEKRDEYLSSLPQPIWNDAISMFTSSLEMPQMLRMPSAINVFHELPFSLCEKPKCLGQDALFHIPYQAHNVMRKPSLQSGAFDDKSARNNSSDTGDFPIAPSAVDTDASGRVMSGYLASNDSSALFSMIRNVDAPGFETMPENVIMDEFVDGIMTTPAWLLSTPPKYLLGEVIITASCISESLPEDGVPKFVIPKHAFRGAIYGLSDLARKAVSKQLLQAIPSIHIIRTEDLVHEYSAMYSHAISLESGERTEQQKLAVLLSSYVQSGFAIPDSIYVAILLQTICCITDGSGFIIEDFPNTRAQASSLLEALSGINYEKPKPCPADRASKLICQMPGDAELYDPSKCGLDKLIYIDAGNVTELSEERLRSRTDLITGASVSITNDIKTVACMQDLYTPLRPVHTHSIDLSNSSSESHDLISFIRSLGLLLLPVNAADFNSLNDAALSIAESISSSFGLQNSVAVPCDEELLENSNVDTDSSPRISQEEKAENEEQVIEPQVSNSVNTVPTPVDMPKLLARALSNMWENSESQLHLSATEYFCALRDMRYQMLQRRRSIHDVIYPLLIRRDTRQDLFETFRNGFNEIPADFRFDLDCVSELHLRTVELGDAIATICFTRRKEADEQLQYFLNDGIVQVSAHRIQCEGAALLQSLFNSFSTSIHLIFDATKSMAKYEKISRVYNSLEETLAISIGDAVKAPAGKDAKGGAKDAKGGKGAAPAPVPFRDPVPCMILSSDIMTTLPGVKVETVEVVDPKAKPKPDKVSSDS